MNGTPTKNRRERRSGLDKRKMYVSHRERRSYSIESDRRCRVGFGPDA